MEIRARYFTIGLFTLGIIAAGFLFVFWLYNSGGIGPRTTYNVRFEGTVAGLGAGAPVTFNGLRVGEVRGIALDPENPANIIVTTAVDPRTPVRSDTKVMIAFQGLTGTPAVAFSGGSASSAPFNLKGGEPPLLVAPADASQSVTESAREVMQRLDAVLGQNSEPLNATIANIRTFSDALARNSNRVDSILAGLERMTGGAAKANAAEAVNLAAASNFKPLAKLPEGQMAIAEPTTVGTLDTDKLALDPAAAPGSGQAQWADVLPKLVQVRLVESFENAGLVGSVLRGSEGAVADFQLQTDIRALQIVGGTSPNAVFDLSAKLLNEKGRILAGRIFHKSVPLAANDPKVAAGALNEAFGAVTAELVPWTVDVLAAQPAPKADADVPPPPQ